ncbi:hypothetical protein Lser_V15G29507 [Lactuca serriola]
MDVQDQSKHSIPSGHESHGVYLCRRCGWPFPNPHPSAKHRRSHKKICGTIDGYTNLIHSEVVSDDENHLDDDKDKTPSPKIQKKTSIGGGGGAIGGSFSRSEDESFLDAVTEFADTTSTGSANKTLDRDLFFSFKDAEHADFKVDSSEAKSALLETNGKSADDLVKDGVVEPTLKQSDISQEAQSIDDVGAGVKLESVTSDGVNEEIKHEKLESESEPVSEVVKEAEIVHGAENINEEIKLEKFEMEHEHASEAVKEPETVQSVSVLTQKEDLGASECSKEQILEVEKEPDMVLTQIKEQIQEVVKEPESVSSEKDDLCAPESEKELSHEVVEEPESVLIEKEDLGAPKLEKDLKEQIQEDFNESIAILTENKNLVAPKLENCSTEEIEEVVKEPKSVLIEKEDLGAPESETHSNKHTHEVFEEPESVLTEKDDLGAPILEKSSKEDTFEVVQEPNSTLIKKDELETPKLENGSTKQIQESVKEPESILTEKQDLDAPESEKCSNEHTHEVVEEPKTVLTEKDDLGASILEKNSKEHTFEAIEEPNSSSIEKEDLGAPNLEKHSNDHTHEVLEEPDTVLTKKVDLEAQNLEKLPKEATKEPKVDDCIVNDKNTSGVVSEPIIGKLITNQDSGVDLSIDSSNSLEANWGSVSVLSTASIDDKPKLNSGKPDNHSGSSDVFEPPSFMTLVQPEGKDQKPCSSEVQDAQKAGWIPTIANVSNESEERKKNEEVIAKVTNWSTGKHSAPLKNLLGEAKSPSVKESVTVVHKDEGATEKVNQELLSSPPKLIEDGKKAGKKVKGRGLWMPFGCCSSVNVVN